MKSRPVLDLAFVFQAQAYIIHCAQNYRRVKKTGTGMYDYFAGALRVTKSAIKRFGENLARVRRI